MLRRMTVGASPVFAIADGAVRLSRAELNAHLELVPELRVEGRWHRGEWLRGDVAPAGWQLDGIGVVTVRSEASAVRLEFAASAPARVEGLALSGSLVLPGARGWHSNGFQSWSQSGALALGPAPDEAALAAALAARGEEEVYRRGRELSWWHTLVGGGPAWFLAGVTTAERFRSWVQVHREPGGEDRLRVRLASGAGEEVPVPAGERLCGEQWLVRLDADPLQALAAYGAALPGRRRRHPVAAPAGWNSWYEMWSRVRQSDVVADLAPGAGTGPCDGTAADNSALVEEILAPLVQRHAGPLHLVVDDGWQRGIGDWQVNDKFPAGIRGMAEALRRRGQRLGLWLAPFLVSPRSPLARQHPDWLVADVRCEHPGLGTNHILDTTHPAAAEHLAGLIREIVAAGVQFLKIDFLFAGAYEGRRHQPVTGMQAYQRGLALVREAAGEEVFVLAVGAPSVPSFAHVDGWRIGNDIAFPPGPDGQPLPCWAFVANQARQLSVRWPYGLATLCDADPALLRVLPRAQVEAGAWVVAAAGGGVFLSDDLRALPVERRGWGWDAERAASALAGQPGHPEHPLPDVLPAELVHMQDDDYTAEHQVPLVWRMPLGQRVAINCSRDARTSGGRIIPGRSALRL
jgi:hypothetical protein